MSWKPFKKAGSDEDGSKAVKLSSPWIDHARKIYALFGRDPEITVVYYQDEPEVKLLVSNAVKAEALASILPAAKQFGTVDLKITVVPPNVQQKTVTLQAAFEGNPAISDIIPIEGVFTNPLTYLVFENDPVQYFNDDLGSVDGVRTTLYETLAEEVLEAGDGVICCTKTDEERKIVWP